MPLIVRRQRKTWLQARIRRVIPPPETILEPVYNVLAQYGVLKCAATGDPLFDKQAWNEASNFLTVIGKGYLSDPQSLSMYQAQRRDKHGLMVYRCVRGTNSLEGGIHQNVIRRFGAYNASPEFACNLMTEYRTRHN